MDYEEKYKKALKWMREVYPTLRGAAKEDAKYYFSELAESEDERIRRKLIAFLKQCKDVYGDGFKQFGLDIEDALAWLEKKSEQKPTECSEEDEIHQLHAISLIEDLKDWANKDGMHSLCIERCIESIDWLKSLKDRVQPQPKQEWNEEDKRIIDRLGEILYDCHSYGECSLKLNEYSNLYDWLKSLRPQSLWKPSIAQLNALSIVSKGNAPDDIEAIVSLYNDLKKLKG